LHTLHAQSTVHTPAPYAHWPGTKTLCSPVRSAAAIRFLQLTSSTRYKRGTSCALTFCSQFANIHSVGTGRGQAEVRTDPGWLCRDRSPTGAGNSFAFLVQPADPVRAADSAISHLVLLLHTYQCLGDSVCHTPSRRLWQTTRVSRLLRSNMGFPSFHQRPSINPTLCGQIGYK
jgi:hypothetical protein